MESYLIFLEHILLPLIEERYFPLFYILLDSSKWNSANCIVKSYQVALEIMQMCVDKIAISDLVHCLEKSVLMTRKWHLLKKTGRLRVSSCSCFCFKYSTCWTTFYICPFFKSSTDSSFSYYLLNNRCLIFVILVYAASCSVLYRTSWLGPLGILL